MTKELDRRFRHVGRIKRSWGTTHKPTIRLMESMMSGLFERGRLDILRGIQDGTYSPLQVWDANTKLARNAPEQKHPPVSLQSFGMGGHK